MLVADYAPCSAATSPAPVDRGRVPPVGSGRTIAHLAHDQGQTYGDLIEGVVVDGVGLRATGDDLH